MKKTFLLILLLCSVLYAQFAKIGLNGMKFLDIGLDARAIGLGEAYASLAEGPSAVFWNPAGLGLAKGIGTFFAYNNWWAGIMHGGVSASYDLGLYGKIAIFYSGLYSGSFEKTTVENPETGINVSYYAYQVGFTYSRFLTDRFSFGISLKVLREKYPPGDLGSIEIWGEGLDIGGLYVTNFRDLKIGLALLNFGPDTRPSGSYYDWEDGSIVSEDGDSTKDFKEYPLPMQFKGGVSINIYEMEGMKLVGAFDIASPGDNLTRYCIGLEGVIQNMIALRAGYEFGRNDGVLGLNTGLGINVGKMAFDYAFSDGGYLPFVHRVSLKMGF